MINQVRLGDIFEFKNGRAFKKTEWSKSGLPIIRIQNLNKAHAPFNYYLGDYDKQIEVNNGDLLFSWSGTVGSSFGPHIWSGEVGVLNQHIFRVSLKKGIEKRYAYYALLEITSEIEKSVSGAVGIVHVTQSNLKNFKIPVPSASEQKRIVATLDEAFAGIESAIANTQKNLTNIRELFESYLSSSFKLEAICKKVLLEEVLSEQPRNGWSPPAKNHTNSGTPVLTLSSVTGFKFRPEKIKHTSAEVNYSRHYWVKNGSLLMTRSNTPELVGHVALASELREATVYPDLIMQMAADSSKALAEFLYFQLRSPVLRREIMDRAQGTNPTMKKVGKKAVQTLPVFIPSIDEQKRIVLKIRDVNDECQRLAKIYNRKLEALRELKKSLLQKAFSGKLAANNVVEITDQKQPPPPIETNSPEFAAHIMAAAYHWHASQSREKTFGRVKAQKTLHLVESLANIDLGRQPIKDAAGPNDFQHMQRAEEWARDRGFFEFIKRPTGQRGYDFRKGAHYGDLVAEAMQALTPYENVLKRVVKVLMPLNTAETEILATAYAAWNNLLLEGIEPTEIAIIHEARENWHADKLKYSEEQFRNAISQLRQNGLVPQGRGKRVTGQESLAL